MIPYGRHSINDEDIAAVINSLKSDWLTTGPLVEEFENGLEKVVGAPCMSVSSGTAARHCAYAAIGLGPGDEVITPPITFIATQATAAFFGAKIVFHLHFFSSINHFKCFSLNTNQSKLTFKLKCSKNSA